MTITEHKHKMQTMGEVATALLQLHLEKPKQFDTERIVSRLFDKFEELELEEEEDDTDTK